MFQLRAWVAVALMAAVAASGGCGSADDDDYDEPPGPQKTVWVAGHKEECTGVGPQECYLVKDSPDGEWTLFYDPIGGFDYEEGYEYEIVVTETAVENPPADASSKKWTFVRLMRRTEASLLDAGSGPLTGHDWSLRVFDLAGAEQSLVTGTEITLILDDEGKIAGTGGCNRYFGSYEIGADDSISFGDVGATRMACPTEIMDQEQRFFTALGAVSGYVVDGGELTLSGGGEAALLFSSGEQSGE
jgi:heat shock protein HslJ